MSSASIYFLKIAYCQPPRRAEPLGLQAAPCKHLSCVSSSATQTKIRGCFDQASEPRPIGWMPAVALSLFPSFNDNQPFPTQTVQTAATVHK